MAGGRLREASLVLMGGYTGHPDAGLPQWKPAMDWNVQCDTDAALTVWDLADDVTMATLNATLGAFLREADLGRLGAAGPLGALLARQARARGADYDMPALGRAHAGLPDDLLNFQYDPVACAVALGWPGVRLGEQRLSAVMTSGVLRLTASSRGRPFRVVTAIDGPAFSQRWLEAVEAAGCVQLRLSRAGTSARTA